MADAVRVQWLLERPELLGEAPFAGEVAQLHASAHARRVAIEARIRAVSHTAPAFLAANGMDEHVLLRGSPRSLGEIAPRGPPSCLGDAAPGRTIDADTDGAARLALAEQLTSADNPLVARVAVNRVWHHLFGRGLVATVDDFGHMGELPTHPELLDRLSTDFVRDGWSLKALIRRIALSATYRQGSQPAAGSLEADPSNHLWHHVPRRRLDGEVLRDAVLSLSGRLEHQLYGPPVPVHLTSFMEGRGRPGTSGPLDGDGRRSIYLTVRRNFLNPFFSVFDTPQPASTVGRRAVSNVPAQALTLLNDPFVHAEAERWAQSVLDETAADEGVRIDAFYRAALARPPTEAERAACQAFLQRQAGLHEQGPEADGWIDDPRPWTDLAHVILNLKEFAFPG